MEGAEEKILAVLSDGRARNLNDLSKESGVPIYLAKSIGKNLSDVGEVRNFASEQCGGAPLYQITS